MPSFLEIYCFEKLNSKIKDKFKFLRVLIRAVPQRIGAI